MNNQQHPNVNNNEKNIFISKTLFNNFMTALITALCSGTFLFAWNLNSRFAVLETNTSNNTSTIQEVKIQTGVLQTSVYELKGQVGTIQGQQSQKNSEINSATK